MLFFRAREWVEVSRRNRCLLPKITPQTYARSVCAKPIRVSVFHDPSSVWIGQQGVSKLLRSCAARHSSTPDLYLYCRRYDVVRMSARKLLEKYQIPLPSYLNSKDRRGKRSNSFVWVKDRSNVIRPRIVRIEYSKVVRFVGKKRREYI